MSDELYQELTLTLTSGRKVHYFGRVQVDHPTEEQVTEISISRPLPLPDGCKWTLIEPTEKKET